VLVSQVAIPINEDVELAGQSFVSLDPRPQELGTLKIRMARRLLIYGERDIGFSHDWKEFPTLRHGVLVC
jgi:hypothetical protein